MGSVDPLQLRGQVLDDLYRVEACVSEDAYSVDYAGLHLGIDEPITIKCLKVPASLGTVLVTSFARRFHDVNRTYARLSQANSNIHKSFAGGTTVSSIKGSLPYIVLEWLEGRTLADEIKQRVHEGRGGRSFDEAYEYLEPALSAITCAHRLGAVHTDLNPTRFFLARSQEGEVFRIRDFCIAKIMSDPVLDPERKGTTRAHVRIFSPAYAAPEQFDERVGVIGTWTDVYAMALVFLEVIEGQHDLDRMSSTVFADESMLRSNRVRARIDALGLSPEVASVFEAALQPSPKERLRNGGELQAKLRAALTKNREASKPTRLSQFPRSSTGSSSLFPNTNRDGGAGPPERRPGTVTDLSALARDVQIREDDSTEARKQTGASDSSLMVTAAEGNRVVVPRGKTSSSSSLTATEAKAPPSFEPGDERRKSSPRLSNTSETATASLALGASMDSLGPAQTGITAFSPRSTAETSVRVSPMGSSGKPAYGFVERPSATDSHEMGQKASDRPTPLPPLPEDYESSASIAFDFRDKRASAPGHPTMPELPSSGPVIESHFQPTPEVPHVQVPAVSQSPWQASDVLAQTMGHSIVSPVLPEEAPEASLANNKDFGSIEEPVPPDETTVPGAVEGWAQPGGPSEAVSGHSPLLRSNGWAQGSGTGPYRNNFIPFGKAARPSKFVRAKQAGLGLVAFGLLAGAFVVASSKFRGEGAESMIPAASAVASKPVEPAPPPPGEAAPTTPSTPTTAGEARPSEPSDEGSFLAQTPSVGSNSGVSPAAAVNGAGQSVVATPAPKRPSRPAGIDRNAARASLDVINSILASCKKTGTVAGPGRAAVTFENDGTVSKVDILGKPYVGTPEGTCVASRLRKAKVAPFHGAAVTLDYGFTIRK